MCGIAGYLGPREIPQQVAEACLSLMHRRGPDARGSYRARTSRGLHVLLLNRRLAIIDLDERANQPFRRGSRIITLNGEIYNFIELREDLRHRDVSFRTNSDTEALLALLENHGWTGRGRAVGMWAFADYGEVLDAVVW